MDNKQLLNTSNIPDTVYKSNTDYSDYPSYLNVDNFMKVISNENKPPIEYISSKLSYSELNHIFYSTGISAIYGQIEYNKILELSKTKK